MSGIKVVILDDRFESYEEEKSVLSEIECSIEMCRSSDEEDIIKCVHDADAIIVNLAPINKRIIKSLKRCRVISRYGVGYDNIDVEEAVKSNIWVANVPDYSIEDVSDHALALLLDCVRKISFKDRKIREGAWDLHKAQPVRRINGKILGIVGYGRIARAFHRKVSGLGLKEVLVYDPYVSGDIIKKYGGRKVDFDYLIKGSDYISIHVPLSKDTKGMFGDREFSKMKRSAILINTSRGAVIEEKSLIKALEEGKIECAGIDVFEKEPLPDNHPFKKLDNVVITDHAAYYSEESIIELKKKAAKNVLEVFKTGRPVYVVRS